MSVTPVRPVSLNVVATPFLGREFPLIKPLGLYECSNCKTAYPNVEDTKDYELTLYASHPKKYKYCPNCGAKIKRGESK